MSIQNKCRSLCFDLHSYLKIVKNKLNYNYQKINIYWDIFGITHYGSSFDVEMTTVTLPRRRSVLLKDDGNDDGSVKDHGKVKR